ncbi:hypothetical protein HPB51_017752 [Rhipicephalus microplus]|uniref:Monocarboxylate transporter n=1 Tax=Rhipicephalus microplus TaxID=6941 RepID=A0A9J6EPZ4_RHIMP|nr:hypothetical protein HPB51_017752 [Rhipicephalus microplus]
MASITPSNRNVSCCSQKRSMLSYSCNGSRRTRMSLDVAPDSQYSWTVAWAAAWNIFCCSLLRRGMPVMFHAVDKTFSSTDKGSVAWTNAFIYSMTYTLFPVTTALCRTMSLRLLSVAGALLIGVGQIACFAIGSLSLVVPAIAVSCDSYDLNGALLVFGATSLNALIGSMFMSRPVWMNPSIPLPPIHRPEASQNTAPAAIQPAATAQENTTKEVVNHKPEVPKPGTVGNEHPMGAKEMPGPSGAAPPGVFTGAPSVLPSGAASLEPGNKVPAGGDAKAQPEPSSLAGRIPNTESATKATTRPDGDKPTASGAGSVPAGNQRPHEHQLEAKEAPVVDVAKVVPTTSSQKTPDMPVGAIMAWHCALTSLSVTASVVVYDYVMNENPERSEQAALTVVSYGAGDLLGRLGYQTMLSTGEHRKETSRKMSGFLVFIVVVIISWSTRPLQGKGLRHVLPVNSVLCLLLPFYTHPRASKPHLPT